MQASDPDFIEDTLKVWQPRTVRTLTPEDARQIAENISGFFRILRAWDTMEPYPAAPSTAPRRRCQ